MDIECQGCYYTLCSFVCLTEDLSEILRFLWRHGCLRKSYSCEKCGRKCAIGDKDLFFRCNRNALDKPVVTDKVETLPVQADTQPGVQPTTNQVQTQENEPLVLHHIHGIHQDQYPIPQLNSSEGSQASSSSIPRTTTTENLLVFSNSVRPEEAALLTNKGVGVNQTLNLNFLPNSVLGHGDIGQENGILTIIDQDGHVSQCGDKNNLELPPASSNLLIIPVVQAQPEVIGSSSSFPYDPSTREACEPRLKVAKKSCEGKTLKKRCNFKVSMKKGTFFEKSKLPIDTVCKFVVFWCCMKHPTQEFLRNELSLATRTVVDWSTACRDICIHWAKSVSEKIGGDGVMVQVDEVKIQEGKETSGQSDGGKNKFSFWGMEKDKEKGKIFIVPVPACDSWSLLTVINDWILPGSVIISNCWKAYDCLKSQEFIQQTVVQSKTFVHPQNTLGPQGFDSKGEEPGSGSSSDHHMPKFGTRRSHHLGDLAEFMFKRRYSNHLERMHAFFKQISLAYPLH